MCLMIRLLQAVVEKVGANPLWPLSDFLSPKKPKPRLRGVLTLTTAARPKTGPPPSHMQFYPRSAGLADHRHCDLWTAGIIEVRIIAQCGYARPLFALPLSSASSNAIPQRT